MYSFDAIVRYSETHGRPEANAATIANYFQDCAIFDSEQAGIGIEYLKEHNRAWFLISWQIDVERYPVLQEKIRVGTWAYDFKGSMGYRNIVIRDERGANIVQAASQWSYIDTETLRPVRIEPEVGAAYPLDEKLPMEYAPRKICLIEGMEEVDRRIVLPYQIDSNNHMNNEAYIALALEYLSEETEISQIRSEYKRQFVKDECIVIKKTERDDLIQFVFADEDDQTRCIVEFKTKRMGRQTA